MWRQRTASKPFLPFRVDSDRLRAARCGAVAILVAVVLVTAAFIGWGWPTRKEHELQLREEREP